MASSDISFGSLSVERDPDGTEVLVLIHQVRWQHGDRFGIFSWNSIIVWLYNLREHWFFHNFHLFEKEGRHVVVRSEEVYLDLLEVPFRSKLRMEMRFGSCEGSTFELTYKIFVMDDDKLELIGTSLVSLACIVRENGVPRKADAPQSVKKLAGYVDPDLRAKSSVFRAQRIAQEKPHWILPLTPRYSDEDTNFHVNHASYTRFFTDAKLLAVRRSTRGPIKGFPTDEVPQEVAELANLQPISLSLFFAREVRIVDNNEFFIRVQANKEANALEFFLFSRDETTGAEKVHTLGRMELSSTSTETSML